MHKQEFIMSIELIELLIANIERTTDISLILANNSETDLAKEFLGFTIGGVK
jgi:hypothetical protein